ncbi:energy-coupling factor transporter transmembrane component T [Anaerotignum sp.]|uniref:energy-coupling factor transporter transmembrane component T n=1 Tax=Anaerotignum sp. TaxID=2039241 RepID=UPI002714C88B|nr:energy-coupling factor transporter transmembrane component T [Anaerotignum sp.]
MGAIPKGVISLDPRTKMLLLIAVSSFIFTNTSYLAEASILVVLMLIAVGLGIPKTALKGIIIYITLSAVKYGLLPILPNMIAANFNIVAVTFRKLLPCFLAGEILVQTTSIRLLMFTLQKLHIPQTLIIPLTITVRYFPALSEERQAISNAMKMRDVKGIAKKLEYIYVPLMITASNTADELSQAITARGIDNPVPKTCAIDIRLRSLDIFMIVASISLLGWTITKMFL